MLCSIPSLASPVAPSPVHRMFCLQLPEHRLAHHPSLLRTRMPAHPHAACVAANMAAPGANAGNAAPARCPAASLRPAPSHPIPPWCTTFQVSQPQPCWRAAWPSAAPPSLCPELPSGSVLAKPPHLPPPPPPPSDASCLGQAPGQVAQLGLPQRPTLPPRPTQW